MIRPITANKRGRTCAAIGPDTIIRLKSPGEWGEMQGVPDGSSWWSPLVDGLSPELSRRFEQEAPAAASDAFRFLSESLMQAAPHSCSLQSGVIARALLADGLLSSNECVILARLALGHDAAFDVRFLAEVCERPGRSWPDGVSEWEMCRALDVLRYTLRNYSRVRIMLLRFLRVPYAQVRSRVAAMTRDLRPNDIWFDCLSSDEDPRVRSNVIEVLEDEETLTPVRRAMLQRASRDHHHRVRTTALYILALFGDSDALGELRQYLQHSDEVWQKAAAWALGRLQTKRLERQIAC